MFFGIYVYLQFHTFCIKSDPTQHLPVPWRMRYNKGLAGYESQYRTGITLGATVQSRLGLRFGETVKLLGLRLALKLGLTQP